MASTALISHSHPFAHSITVRNPFHPHQDRQITAIPGPVPLRALVPEMDQPILVLRNGDATVLIDSLSLEFMGGAEIDYVDDLIGQSFQIRNPNAVAGCGCGTSFAVA